MSFPFNHAAHSFTEIVQRGEVYTIVEESDGFGAAKCGKLASGAGWIALDYVTKE